MLCRSRTLANLVTISTKSLPQMDGHVAHVVLNHPLSRNALTVGMGEEFTEQIGKLAHDQQLRAVVLTGSGQAFSAGGDASFLKQRLTDTRENNIQAMRDFYARFLCIRSLPVPVIAAINGHAIGAGLCIALSCDYRIAVQNARLAVNFTKLGIHPGMGATFTLPRLVGERTSRDLLLTGREFRSEEALRLGVVDKVVSSTEELMEESHNLAVTLNQASRIAVQETLITLRGTTTVLESALQREAEAQAVCYADGKDLKQALEALMSRGKPNTK